MRVNRGNVVLCLLEPTVGHEQSGMRPCIVISDPDVAASQKYPLVCVVPVTSTPGEGALYPMLEAGSGGLRNRSFALVDQIRALDKQRVRKLYGRISPSELRSIEDGLRLYLALGPVAQS